MGKKTQKLVQRPLIQIKKISAVTHTLEIAILIGGIKHAPRLQGYKHFAPYVL
jgi:hypothetical protein